MSLKLLFLKNFKCIIHGEFDQEYRMNSIPKKKVCSDFRFCFYFQSKRLPTSMDTAKLHNFTFSFLQTTVLPLYSFIIVVLN